MSEVEEMVSYRIGIGPHFLMKVPDEDIQLMLTMLPEKWESTLLNSYGHLNLTDDDISGVYALKGGYKVCLISALVSIIEFNDRRFFSLTTLYRRISDL